MRKKEKKNERTQSHIASPMGIANEIGSRTPCMRPRSDPPKMKNSTQTTRRISTLVQSNVVRSRLIILINEEINEANWMASNSAKLDRRTKYLPFY